MTGYQVPAVRVFYWSAATSHFSGRFIVDCAACGYVGKGHGSRREAEASARIHRRDRRTGSLRSRR